MSNSSEGSGRSRTEDEPRVVLERRPPRSTYLAGAVFSLVAIVLGAIGLYVEYLGEARAPLLALGLSGLLLALAALVLLGFRSSFAFRTEQGLRPYAPPSSDGSPGVSEALGLSAGRPRRIFVGLLGTGFAGLGAALLLPLRSLGNRPSEGMGQGRWRRGTRLMTPEGRPVVVQDLPVGSSLAVVPDGNAGDYPSVATLVRLAEVADSSSEAGLRAYSRICSHAGCAVSIFNRADNTLVCPCHWSVFDASTGAVVSGPAPRPLARLPIGLGEEGYLVAMGPLEGPVGPPLGAVQPTPKSPRSRRVV